MTLGILLFCTASWEYCAPSWFHLQDHVPLTQ